MPSQIRFAARLVRAGAFLALFPMSAGAAIIVTPFPETYLWSVDTIVPDNDPVGIADTRAISGSRIGSITDLSVSIRLAGGFAGDLYASLTHDSGFSVLLNRIGRTSSNILGSDAATLDLMLQDSAAVDIHAATPVDGTIAGFFQPDARETSPLAVLDTSPRSAFLDSFTGQDANGSWTLFVADLSGADQFTLEDWGLTISGVIPEPPAALLALAAGLPLAWRRRHAR